MKRLKLWLPCLCVMIAALILVSIPKQQKLTIGIFAGSNWNVPSSASDERIENAIAAFNEIYPDVKVEFQSGIRPELYEEWLSRQIINDQLPDVFFVPSQMFSLLANNGSLADLTYLSNHDNRFNKEEYYANSLKEGMKDNKLYALPYESVPTLMFVNKTLLDKEGISMPDSDWTWMIFIQSAIRSAKIQTVTAFRINFVIMIIHGRMLYIAPVQLSMMKRTIKLI